MKRNPHTIVQQVCPCTRTKDGKYEVQAAIVRYQGGGLALIFMRSDTRWFQRCVLHRARYLFLWKGRIRFCRPDGETPGNQPNAPSCLVAWDIREAPLLHTLQNQGLGKVAVL